MPSLRDDVFFQVRQVEREFAAARLAMDRLLVLLNANPSELNRDLTVSDVQSASDHLEDTYFIRLFAEFESALRDFWRATRGNDSPSRTRDLIQSIAGRQKVPDDWVSDTHDVREYRNNLVHQGGLAAQPLALAVARSRLCRFLSFLPIQW